jgi:tripartite-type tricarboxylate transporter receptor subunit TctC
MRTYIISILCLLSLLLVPPVAQAQSDFPNKPITIVVGMVAGGTADLSSRWIGKIAEKYLGQPFAVVNKLGGAGTVGTAALASAKPDGYTLGTLLTSPMVTVPHVAKLTYHPVKDIDPIIQYGVLNFAVSVREDSPFKTFKEAMEYARKNPGVVTYGTAGTNSAQHIIMEGIAREEKVEVVHVPFKGGPEALAAAMGGHVSLAAGDFNASLVKGKKMRLLAMFLEEPWAEFPDVPTLKDLGYSVPIPYFVGLGAPKGVPEPIMKKLEEAFTKASKDPEFSSGMKTIGLPAYYRNRKDFSAFIALSFEQMGKSIQELKNK